MKVCIFGAGAIGGYMAVELADAGEAEVTCIARGPHLAAMRENGLRLVREDADDKVVQVRCTDSPAEVGPQDVVIVTLKAHSAAAGADQMTPLFGPDTAVVTAQNGVPWWYFYKLGGTHDGTRVASVDPAMGCDRTRAGNRLRGLSGRRNHRARRHQARVWQPVHTGRAVR